MKWQLVFEREDAAVAYRDLGVPVSRAERHHGRRDLACMAKKCRLPTMN